jgi:hypothetical protein
MKLYKLDDIPPRAGEQVFKTSPVGKLIWLAVFSAVAIASLVEAVRGGIHADRWNVPSAFLYFIALLFGLITWYAYSVLRASLKPTNWLFRCDSNGVLINFRSYLNWRLPAGDVHAVGFDYSEIASARIIKHNNSPQTAHRTYLALGLAHPDTAALETQLQAERDLAPDGIVITCDYPVSVLPDGTIEIWWDRGVSPSVAKAIQYLGQHVQIAAAESRIIDLVHRRNQTPEQEKGKIVELLKNGDRMGAIELTRQVYSYNLTQAQDYVDKLQPGN